MILFIVCGLLFAVLVLYWYRMNVWNSDTYSVSHLGLLPLILLALIVLQNVDPDRKASRSPVLVAIATDVSLSMATMPEPRLHEGVGTRLKRAQLALLPLLSALESSTHTTLISLTAFTSKAETILGWDDDLPQVREAVEYVVAPGLLSESGSDLGVALDGVKPMFDVLPPEYRRSEQAKFLILVSDGEQNMDKADSSAAIAKLRDMGVKFIMLHVGTPDKPEGLPIYSDDGKFVGFDEVGGQIFSVPNPDIMRAMAGQDATQGIFVKAEDPDAARIMMDYMGVQVGSAGGDSLRMGLILALWSLVMVVMLRYV